MAATQPQTSKPAGSSAPPAKDMVWVPGGDFLMGSEDFYPEERPVHQVKVDGFWMDTHLVTNAEFRRYPGADPALLVPGSLVFRPTSGPVDLRDWRTWWAWVPGASWRHPDGPGSTLHGPRPPARHHSAEEPALAGA